MVASSDKFSMWVANIVYLRRIKQDVSKSIRSNQVVESTACAAPLKRDRGELNDTIGHSFFFLMLNQMRVCVLY